MGTCPDIKTNIAILISAYEASRESQIEIADALARAARARIAEDQVYFYFARFWNPNALHSCFYKFL